MANAAEAGGPVTEPGGSAAKTDVPAVPAAGSGLTAKLPVKLGAAAAAVAVSAVGAWLGLWWVPFVVGVAAGVLGKAGKARVVLPAAAGGAAGWLLPVWVLALRGQPAGATARVIAALAGLPPYAAVTLAVLALLAALQVWVGAWLASAITASAAMRRRPAIHSDERR